MISIRMAWIGAVVMAGSMLTASVALAKPAPLTVGAKRDSQITRQLRRELSRQMPDSTYRIRISTKNGVVTLSGLANSGESELKAVHDAQVIHGVRRVKDHLSVVS